MSHPTYNICPFCGALPKTSAFRIEYECGTQRPSVEADRWGLLTSASQEQLCRCVSKETSSTQDFVWNRSDECFRLERFNKGE